MLPPSYFHTYLLLASLGGLTGYVIWKVGAHVFDRLLERKLADGARTQVERELTERILPLSIEERQAARGPRRHRLPRVLLASVIVIAGLSTSLAIYAEVPQRILSLSQLPVSAPAARMQQGLLYLGVPPVHSIDITHQAYRGLPDYLSEKTNLQVKLVSAETYTEVGWGLMQGSVDAALVPAGAASALLREAAGAVTCIGQVVRAGQRDDTGVIIARRPDITRPEHLIGKRVAFVRIDSLSGYWAPTSILREHGVALSALSRVVMAGDHSEALRLLDGAEVDAAASFQRSLELYQAKHPAFQPRVLATIPHLPNDVLLVATRLPKNRQKTLLAAFQSVFRDRASADLRARLVDVAGISDIAAADASALADVAHWMH